MPCFTTKHSSVCCCCHNPHSGGLFTVLLFFGQWFPLCSKVMIWTKNTYYNGFMDSHHAPFTPKHRYWVLLFALIAHNLVVAMSPDTSLPVLSAGCVAVGLISLNNRVYKKKLNEYLEALFLLNLGILSLGTSYVVETHQQQETLTNVSMSIAFILFVTIISYHFHHFILKNKIWLKIKQVAKNLRTGQVLQTKRIDNLTTPWQCITLQPMMTMINLKLSYKTS